MSHADEAIPVAAERGADVCEPVERGRFQPPHEAASNNPDVLRAALIRASAEHRRAECRATMQTEVVKLAVDLLVREPDIEGFFGGLTRTMVEESESHTCAVWLINDAGEGCDLWLAYVKDRLFTPAKFSETPCALESGGKPMRL